MKSHLFTALLLLLAGALYVAGFAGGMTAAVGAAVALEIYFWMRVIRGKCARKANDLSSGSFDQG